MIAMWKWELFQKVSFVDSKGHGHKNLIYDDKSVEDIINNFKESNIDDVFIINYNFGNKELAADIAKTLGKPVLLWTLLIDGPYIHHFVEI